MKLSGPMLPPKRGGAPRQAVVLLHGYGSDGRDLIGLGNYWRDLLPEALFVAPNAPEPCRDNPTGYQWFPVDFSRPEYRFDGASIANPVIVEFLRDMWLQTGLGPGDTILGGFSQGAMMALNVGLSLKEQLMGVIAFSGALIPPPGFADGASGASSRPPICLVHGDRDPVVDPALSAEAAEILRGKGFSVDYCVEAGAGHTIVEDGLSFASAFISKVAAVVL